MSKAALKRCVKEALEVANAKVTTLKFIREQIDVLQQVKQASREDAEAAHRDFQHASNLLGHYQAILKDLEVS